MTKIKSIISGINVSKPNHTVSAEERWNLIAQAAYFRASERGFSGGDAFDDWLVAEKQIDGGLPRRNMLSVIRRISTKINTFVMEA